MSKAPKGKRKPSRERRSFSDEFKREAVRRLHERRATGGTLAEDARVETRGIGGGVDIF